MALPRRSRGGGGGMHARGSGAGFSLVARSPWLGAGKPCQARQQGRQGKAQGQQRATSMNRWAGTPPRHPVPAATIV
jgi:hypothetical protein